MVNTLGTSSLQGQSLVPLAYHHFRVCFLCNWHIISLGFIFSALNTFHYLLSGAFLSFLIVHPQCPQYIPLCAPDGAYPILPTSSIFNVGGTSFESQWSKLYPNIVFHFLLFFSFSLVESISYYLWHPLYKCLC